MRAKERKAGRLEASGKKKILLAALCGALALSAVAGGIVAARKKSMDSVVNVYPVEYFSMSDYYADRRETEGSVSTDRLQNIHLSGTEIITKIYVTEGQTVKKGDPLIAYDTTLTQIDLDRQSIALSKLELELKEARALLQYYKGLRPYVPPAPVPETTPAETTTEPETTPPRTTPAEATPETTPGQSQSEDAQETQPAETQPAAPVLLGGSGTKEDPQQYLWPQSQAMSEAILLTLMGERQELFVSFYIFEQDNSAGECLWAWQLHCRLEDETLCWQTIAVAESPRSPLLPPEPEEPSEPEQPVEPEPVLPEPEHYYTAAELVRLRAEQEEKIRSLDLQHRMAKVEYERAVLELSDGVVYSQVDGTVLALRTEQEAKASGEPLLTVSGGGGYLVTGYISELALDTVKPGDTVMISSWYNGMEFEGTVMEISDIPAQAGMYYGGDRGNASYYPFTVSVPAEAGLREYDYVGIQYGMQPEGEESFYVEKILIARENGQYFVYADKDGKLEKRPVSVGRELHESYYEVKSGVDVTDSLAFPYGVYEGAKTRLAEPGELYGW